MPKAGRELIVCIRRNSRCFRTTDIQNNRLQTVTAPAVLYGIRLFSIITNRLDLTTSAPFVLRTCPVNLYTRA